MGKFVGRKRELQLLDGLTHKKSASLVVVNGRRRIGKSRLIEEFGKKFKSYTFSGIPPTPETTKQSQIDVFMTQMSNNFGSPKVQFTDWWDVFCFLAEYVKRGKILIVFDEISWIGSKDPDFLGKIKNLWDLKLKQNNKLILVLCGSISAWIERNILRSTGFVGRISLHIPLGELSLSECNEFFGNKYISAFEKFKILSVTGGVPKYLEEIRLELTAEENIKNTCFINEGYLTNEFEKIFCDAFLARSDFYEKALKAVVSCSMEPKKLCQAVGYELNNATSDYLEELTQAGFIQRDYTWHLKSQTASKLSHYRLKDNYARFYLKYILPNINKIRSGSFDDKTLSGFPGWNSIMGLQFENLVLNNRKKIWELLKISPNEIVWDNPFFQRKTTKQPGCQIDYLIQTKYNNLYLCEIKFSLSEIKADIIKEVEKKISLLQRPKGYSCRPILINVNGVHEGLLDQDYFAHIINFNELLKT
ncbi:MAG: Archaeal ATPase family protein [Candidatus Midichloriaceae bacterium]|jgi:AAA+ ATPase superfamily predicted ATPase|nr:Archaeal ATPase family protein [Candidatus Midichloriaceae bacterium]